MSRYTITPWRTQSDLLSVRQQLYSLDTTTPEEDHRRAAVDRIMAWKLRGNLPHAVESTALLVDAILHHDLSVNSIFSVRAVYAAAFTRFVTGFCDIGRNRERALEPSSMLEIARQIDMPDEFVALRHEATHEELPSVQRLVAVCGQALEWLWRVYWGRLAEEVVVEPVEEALVDLQVVREEGRRVLREFRSARKQSLKGKGGGSAQELVKKTTKECQALCRDQEAAVTVFTGMLIGDKILYPSDRGYVSDIFRIAIASKTNILQTGRTDEWRISSMGRPPAIALKTPDHLPTHIAQKHACRHESTRRLSANVARSRKRSLAPLAPPHRHLGRLVESPTRNEGRG